MPLDLAELVAPAHTAVVTSEVQRGVIGDCSASERFFGVDGDLTAPFVIDDGKLRVPTGPGLGVEPIPERLTRCTIARERLTARG